MNYFKSYRQKKNIQKFTNNFYFINNRQYYRD